MKERPILFSAPMVRAILDGRKTQTRRVVKPQPELTSHSGFLWKGYYSGTGFDMKTIVRNFSHRCPYGVFGDRLWVRECWAPVSTFDPSPDTGALYRADTMYDAAVVEWKWRPSIHMPRWASRITLEVVAVRVERLQDISEADAQAEGVASDRQRESTWYDGKAVRMFRDLWSSINGVASWDANPWVWVVEFKRLESHP